jgi:hypothetical protein
MSMPISVVANSGIEKSAQLSNAVIWPNLVGAPRLESMLDSFIMA